MADRTKEGERMEHRWGADADILTTKAHRAQDAGLRPTTRAVEADDFGVLPPMASDLHGYAMRMEYQCRLLGLLCG